MMEILKTDGQPRERLRSRALPKGAVFLGSTPRR